MNRRWILGGLLAAGGVGLVRLLTAHPKIRADTRLLLIGDSLAQGLDPHLKQLAAEEGIGYQSRAVRSTRIDQWAQSEKLADVLENFQPTLVLVSLGTNDEAMAGDAVERQQPYLDQLIAKLDGPDVVWIGPLLRAGHESNGVTEAIADSVKHYFDTAVYDIPRGPDGLHPTAAGYAGWAGAVWRWLS